MTPTTKEQDWLVANQRYLMAALAVVRQRLERYVAGLAGTRDDARCERDAQQTLQDSASAMPAPPALETLCQSFNLSPFEREVLLLTAGVELEASFGALCGVAQGDQSRTGATFSLALAALTQPHWSALTPASPLRHWRLIELTSGSSLTQSALHIDESILHYLAGAPHMDERLVGIIEPVRCRAELVPSHAAVAERVIASWSAAPGQVGLPVIQLCGDESAGKRDIIAAACDALGLGLHMIPAQFIPTTPSELEVLAKLWGREAVLNASALLVDCDSLDVPDTARAGSVSRWINCTPGPLIVTSRERWPLPERQSIVFEVSKPTAAEQRAVWEHALGQAAQAAHGQVERLVTQFHLSAPAIRAVCIEASTGGSGLTADQLWDASRVQSRSRLDQLAQRLDPSAAWDDLVLPEAQRETLRAIVMHVNHRATVHERWGFAARGARGLGISALFSGASGTGKTMAAEVLAGELQLDLYRIDLSAVVSKYIGETEKNLRAVFDAAEHGGAILLFDEADALFGKRSEVKDSHDRYANIEVSYLLQRMESYRGLAILTTNLKNTLDTAFLRRIRFSISFPFPDVAQRAEIWRRIFPANTPTDALDVAKLARLNVAGGHIRNIALSAAFWAADAGEPIRMPHLQRAARSEYAKLEKTLTESEIGGWV